jgi:hypothetical protein
MKDKLLTAVFLNVNYNLNVLPKSKKLKESSCESMMEPKKYLYFEFNIRINGIINDELKIHNFQF